MIPDIEKFLPVTILKMATTIPHKFNIVRFQHPELIPDIEKFLPILKMVTSRNFSMSGINSGCWNRTMLNLCGIVAAILKMVTGRNFSMSGIISGHHNLPTCEMSWNDSWHRKISTGRHFQNGHHNTAQIQHCPISTTFHMWVDYDVPKWFLTSKNFYRPPFSKMTK
jgi:hypothetical protein